MISVSLSFKKVAFSVTTAMEDILRTQALMLILNLSCWLNSGNKFRKDVLDTMNIIGVRV